MAGPKIQVSADLSSFDAEIQKLKSSISQLGEKLKTETGKADLNFSGPQKQLAALIAQADKLTAALNKTDKTSASYAKNLKAASAAMSDAAKLSSRIESQGGSSNRNTSNYFSGYAGELRQEVNDNASADAIQRDRERTQARLDNERQANTSRWANRAARLAGFAGGTMLGGGGGYAAMGAGVGSMLPGWMGAVGGSIGGTIGGLADKTIGANKDEALRYSELRRSMGGITVDFEDLRKTVRNTVTGFGVTNVEAAALAKNFAKTANLSGDINKDISRSVGTSAGMAQGYGIAPGQTTDFFAQMRVNGVGKNDQDNRRLALQIGEAVARSGTSVKMDETLSAISNFTAKSASQTMTTPDFGSFTSLLTSMTGSNYAGLRGNVVGASGILDRANSGVLGSGSAGEASSFQWMQAQQSAMPGLNGLDVSTNQSAGLLGDIASLYSPGSPIYDNADSATRAHYDKLREGFKKSGMKNMLGVGIAHAKAISNNSQEMNMNVQRMFGLGSSQEAAVLQKFHGEMGANGYAEAMLKKQGINLDNIDPSKISALATTISGSSADRKGYFNSIKGRLSKADALEGESAMASGDSQLQEFLIKAIKNGSATNDPGLEAQKSSVEIQNKIAESMTGLIGIENVAKEALLGIWRKLDPDNSQLKGIDAGNVAANGKDRYGHNAFRAGDVSEAVYGINSASSIDEKKRIARKLLGIYDQQQGTGFPSNTEKLIEDALYPPNAGKVKDSAQSSYGDKATISPWSGGLTNRQKRLAGMVRSKSKYDSLFSEAGAMYGIDPLVIKQLAAQESSFNPSAVSSDGGMGMMQHQKQYMGERGLNSSNWSDPRTNVMAGAKFFKQLLKKANGNYHDAFRMYNGSGDAAERYADNAMGVYNSVHDQLPDSHKRMSEGALNHTIKGTFVLNDSKGNHVADPIYHSSTISAPRAAGMM